MKRIAFFLTSALAIACTKERPPVASPSPAHAAAAVHVHVSLGPKLDPSLPRAGTMLAYWMTKADYDQVMSGSRDLTPLARLLDRVVVIGPADLGKGSTDFSLDVEPGEIVLSAFLDTQHDAIGSMLGAARSPDGDLMGDSKPVVVSTAASATAQIVLDQVAEHPRGEEPCAGDGRQLVTLDAPEVAGTMNNATSRRLCVILPKGYAANSERRYPVVYEFPGWGGDDGHYVSQYHHDALFRDAAPEAILVLVDTSTKSGSSYLVDSPRTGAWDSFISKRVIPTIDARFRTIAKREGRATAGLSTGGFGALSYGLRHPELIGVVTASAPDGVDIARWLFGTPGGRPVANVAGLHSAIPAWTRALIAAERTTGGAGLFVSYGADWSPDNSSQGWESPLDPSTGALVPSVVAKWRAQSPAVWLDDPERAAALKRVFDDKLCLSVGKKDEFDLYPEVVAFDHQLAALGIRHELLLAEGGHIDPMVMTNAYRCAAAHLAK